MSESELQEPPAVESAETESVGPDGPDGPEEASAGLSPSEMPETAPEEAAPEQYGLLDRPEASESEEARVKAVIEAVIYVTDEPLTASQIALGLGQPKDRIEKLLEELTAEFNVEHHGLTVREVAGGYKMSTKPEFHDDIRAFVKKLKPQFKLSLAALETLAVIAYKQPVTAPEIMEIRGVQGAGVLKTLLERKLIATAGRKQVVGKPVLYKTTKEFLVQFGLKDLSELPTLKEFEEWSRLALGDDDAPTEESAAPTSAGAADDSAGEAPASARGDEAASPEEPVTAGAEALPASDEPPGAAGAPPPEAGAESPAEEVSEQDPEDKLEE